MPHLLLRVAAQHVDGPVALAPLAPGIGASGPGADAVVGIGGGVVIVPALLAAAVVGGLG